MEKDVVDSEPIPLPVDDLPVADFLIYNCWNPVFKHFATSESKTFYGAAIEYARAYNLAAPYTLVVLHEPTAEVKIFRMGGKKIEVERERKWTETVTIFTAEEAGGSN